METRTAKPAETYAESVYRLLQKANERSIRLFMEHETERWFATSASMDGIVHEVSAIKCNCPGYAAHGRCSHHALYLEQQGLRPPTQAELDAAEAEWQRMQSLLSRHQIKSTNDWRAFQRIKATYERLARLADSFAYGPAPAA